MRSPVARQIFWMLVVSLANLYLDCFLLGGSRPVRGGDKPQRLSRAPSGIYLADHKTWLKNRDPSCFGLG